MRIIFERKLPRCAPIKVERFKSISNTRFMGHTSTSELSYDAYNKFDFAGEKSSSYDNTNYLYLLRSSLERSTQRESFERRRKSEITRVKKIELGVTRRVRRLTMYRKILPSNEIGILFHNPIYSTKKKSRKARLYG